MLTATSCATLLVITLCLAASAIPSKQEPAMIAPSTPFNNARIQDILDDKATSLEGRPGFWQFTYNNVTMLCITDKGANRMRIIAPVAVTAEVSPEVLTACMSANFDRALDARYCTHDEQLWSAFIHPLGEMTVGFFHSALDQVAGLVHNFGTSYASGALVFGGDAPGKAEEPTDDGDVDESP